MEDRKEVSAFHGQCLPLTPDSPMHPTLLPHVKEALEPIDPLPTSAASSNNGPITPPSPATSSTTDTALTRAPQSALLNGLHMLASTRDALTQLHHIYATSPTAQDSFTNAVDLIASSVRRGGKLIVSGVGKSGKIGQKFVATCNSLGILSIFLHATEALHGDLGVIGSKDTLLLITHSSHTPELHALLPHTSHLPLIAITAHPNAATNPLFTIYPRTAPSVLLPAPVPVLEKELFGVAAPTTSTTVALAMCDALGLSVAEEVYGEDGDGGGRAGGVKEVFRGNHPGGAIGMGVNTSASHVKRRDDGERMEMG